MLNVAVEQCAVTAVDGVVGLLAGFAELVGHGLVASIWKLHYFFSNVTMEFFLSISLYLSLHTFIAFADYGND